MATIATTRATLPCLLALLILSHTGQSAKAPAPSAAAAAPSGAMGPAAASGPAASDCFTILLGMADCLTYVQTGSNLTKPDKPCCPELKSLVDTNPVCLCELLANGSSSGFDIDLHRATKLPSVCKVKTPPVDTCALLGYPVGGPTAGPTSSEGPSEGGLPSAGSSTATSPSPNNGIRVSAISMASNIALLVGFAIAFF